MKNMMPIPYSKKMKMNVDSEFYFNEPNDVKDMKTYSDVYPVDVQGACVPTDKNADLKETESNIQERFGLEAGGEA